jgi:hypothetical protein
VPEEFTYKPRDKKKRRKVAPFMKVAALAATWCLIAGVSFAAWNALINPVTGNIQLSTTSPASYDGSLTFRSADYGGANTSFVQTNTDASIMVNVTLPATGATYAHASTVATSSQVSGGCPAGSVTIAGGQALTFQDPILGTGGTSFNTTATPIVAHLIASAPNACQNQTLTIPVTVNVLP